MNEEATTFSCTMAVEFFMYSYALRRPAISPPSSSAQAKYSSVSSALLFMELPFALVSAKVYPLGGVSVPCCGKNAGIRCPKGNRLQEVKGRSWRLVSRFGFSVELWLGGQGCREGHMPRCPILVPVIHRGACRGSYGANTDRRLGCHLDRIQA